MFRRFLSPLLSMTVLVFLDWITKLVVLLKLYETQGSSSLSILYQHRWGQWAFSIIPTYNEGAAFGLFASYKTPLLIVRIVIITCLLLFLLFRDKQLTTLIRVSLILICAGAIGNVGDLLFYDHVVDFLSISYRSWAFPTFNVADTLISLGTFMLLGDLFLAKKHSNL